MVQGEKVFLSLSEKNMEKVQRETRSGGGLLGEDEVDWRNGSSARLAGGHAGCRKFPAAGQPHHFSLGA